MKAGMKPWNRYMEPWKLAPSVYVIRMNAQDVAKWYKMCQVGDPLACPVAGNLGPQPGGLDTSTPASHIY